jgi:hypothetical protein
MSKSSPEKAKPVRRNADGLTLKEQVKRERMSV